MSKTTIVRRFEFDAGHRVLNHEGKCRHLHGHRYAAEVEFTAAVLDDLGRVIDFGEVKNIVGRWIDNHLDHNMILHPDDPLINSQVEGSPFDSQAIGRTLIGREPFIMSEHAPNPTAENIARVLYENVSPLMERMGIKTLAVVLWETPNCRAEYRPE